ncbi:hypothetical protein CDAR_374991 [Caerostris darwini]|uniref:Uncharacterized protein n=1 Tax=Caerostris darwini TaxID=1538125 RepID=A0AAV4RKA6_9ARAC|nr:hypothetical protein CDAR_374991 [Caerostris darwini]
MLPNLSQNNVTRSFLQTSSINDYAPWTLIRLSGYPFALLRSRNQPRRNRTIRERDKNTTRVSITILLAIHLTLSKIHGSPFCKRCASEIVEAKEKPTMDLSSSSSLVRGRKGRCICIVMVSGRNGERNLIKFFSFSSAPPRPPKGAGRLGGESSFELLFSYVNKECRVCMEEILKDI